MFTMTSWYEIDTTKEHETEALLILCIHADPVLNYKKNYLKSNLIIQIE